MGQLSGTLMRDECLRQVGAGALKRHAIDINISYAQCDESARFNLFFPFHVALL